MIFRLPLLFVALLFCLGIQAQDNARFEELDANYYYGSILRHNKDIAHLIQGHPTGLVLSYNRKTFGARRWERTYGYPDWGLSFVYQNSGYSVLGENYGLYAHANFYFLKRHLMLRIGQGIAYASNPFDLNDNFKNNAYGSDLLSSTYVLLNFKWEDLFSGFGVQAGFHFLHYSNGNFRAPNSSTNALTFNLGINYQLNRSPKPEYQGRENDTAVKDKIRFNFLVRAGVNESDYLNLGRQPFLVLSAFADKRLSYTSSLLFGAEVFFSKFLEKEIEYLVASQLDRDLTGDEDYRRVGMFVGHDLHFDRLSVLAQLGYYVYYPYDFEGRTYIRAGLRYFFLPKLFGVVSMKSHGAKVEGVEFGVGVRL
ncbi:acyloxyacyl hydrolase [Aureitalea marina]|uniref:Deacylase n=1 Tax=Aureitalea marina TaxID=930804 RepID=A0A2S7KM19_9FLAO|nr:acyloxyacyl hydrolase [Aureitalea marina]PQB03648.1 deacylase [Aureitalea marina]